MPLFNLFGFVSEKLDAEVVRGFLIELSEDLNVGITMHFTRQH